MLAKKDRTAVQQIELVCLESLVPENHLLRAVQESIDFSFIYDEMRDLYSENHGRPSVDPVVLIKLLMLQALFGIRSMRQTIEEVKVNVAYRWFLGYGLQEHESEKAGLVETKTRGIAAHKVPAAEDAL